MFCVLNGYILEVPTDDAVDLMLAIAAGELAETDVAAWLTERLQPQHITPTASRAIEHSVPSRSGNLSG